MRFPGPRVILSIAVLVAVLSYAAYALGSAPDGVNLPNPPSSFSTNGHTFGITYLATNQSRWEAGLMNRKITNSTTMLFVFPDFGIRVFWMSHVNSSLDIIWLNVTGGSGRVVSLASDVLPCTSALVCPDYQPSAAANWVLETKGGFAKTYDIEIGTVIEFS